MYLIGEWAVFAGDVSFKTKQTSKHSTLVLPKHPSLAKPATLSLHQLVRFAEDGNAPVIIFLFFKGSSQPTESIVYLSTT